MNFDQFLDQQQVENQANKITHYTQINIDNPNFTKAIKFIKGKSEFLIKYNSQELSLFIK